MVLKPKLIGDGLLEGEKSPFKRRFGKVKKFLHKSPPGGKFKKGKSEAKFFEDRPVRKGRRGIALPFGRRSKQTSSGQESAQDFLLGN